MAQKIRDKFRASIQKVPDLSYLYALDDAYLKDIQNTYFEASNDEAD